MLRETRRGEPSSPPTIEITGTPFAARRKLILHNAIGDMLKDRLEIGDVRGYQGLDENFLPATINSVTAIEYFRQTRHISELLAEWRFGRRAWVVEDDAFAAMAYTHFLKRSQVFSPSEAENLTRGLLPLVQMENFIILTIVRPRAALIRELYPPQLEGYEEIMRHKFIAFTVFNEAIETVIDKYKDELPPIQIFRYPEDDIDPADIVFRNADAVFEFLKLPSVDEWTDYLTKHPEARGKIKPMFGFSLAGLTRDEIAKKIQERDWSKDPNKRARVNRLSETIVRIVEEEIIKKQK